MSAPGKGGSGSAKTGSVSHAPAGSLRMASCRANSRAAGCDFKCARHTRNTTHNELPCSLHLLHHTCALREGFAARHCTGSGAAYQYNTSRPAGTPSSCYMYWMPSRHTWALRKWECGPRVLLTAWLCLVARGRWLQNKAGKVVSV